MLIKLKIVMNNINTFMPLPQGARELSVVENQQVAGGPVPVVVVFAAKAFAGGFFGAAGAASFYGLYKWFSTF